ncbi:hypothetical protein E2C01_041362 [Portunus trituberculatus]|uniref:Uncharacterized protein n=1 Tax=Portunus trituberculatus TaxID=210409 RepID=A0A5B7FJV3_PORTR|nr:hypothetical protein [Portunus trituberculatus]
MTCVPALWRGLRRGEQQASVPDTAVASARTAAAAVASGCTDDVCIGSPAQGAGKQTERETGGVAQVAARRWAREGRAPAIVMVIGSTRPGPLFAHLLHPLPLSHSFHGDERGYLTILSPSYTSACVQDVERTTGESQTRKSCRVVVVDGAGTSGDRPSDPPSPSVSPPTTLTFS